VEERVLHRGQQTVDVGKDQKSEVQPGGRTARTFRAAVIEMKHSEFYIGQEFFTGSGKWRCTDVGTRVIVAISLEPHAVTQSWKDDSGWHKRHQMSNDPSWFNGPPYAVGEHVFDEYGIEGCWAKAEEVPKVEPR